MTIELPRRSLRAAPQPQQAIQIVSSASTKTPSKSFLSTRCATHQPQQTTPNASRKPATTTAPSPPATHQPQQTTPTALRKPTTERSSLCPRVTIRRLLIIRNVRMRATGSLTTATTTRGTTTGTPVTATTRATTPGTTTETQATAAGTRAATRPDGDHLTRSFAPLHQSVFQSSNGSSSIAHHRKCQCQRDTRR